MDELNHNTFRQKGQTMSTRYMHLQCEDCGKRLKVSAAKAGKTGQCPQCGARIPIPPPCPEGNAHDSGHKTSFSPERTTTGGAGWTRSPWLTAAWIGAVVMAMLLGGYLFYNHLAASSARKQVRRQLARASSALDGRNLKQCRSILQSASTTLDQAGIESGDMRDKLESLTARMLRRAAELKLRKAERQMRQRDYDRSRSTLARARRLLRQRKLTDSPIGEQITEYLRHLNRGDVLYKGQWMRRERAEKRSKGYLKYKGRWVKKQDVPNLKKGLVKYRGEWVSPREKANRKMGLVQFRGEWITPEQARQRKHGLVIPIIGAINSRTAQIVQEGVEKALRQDIGTVVLYIDSPGGAIQSATYIAGQLDRLRKRHLCAFISSRVQGGAWSAGAFLAFCCDTIYMTPGACVGAAQSVVTTPDGMMVPTKELPAGAKFESTWVGKFRSRAQQNGYPGAIAVAMTKQDATLWVRHRSGNDPSFRISDRRPGQDGWSRLDDDEGLLSLTASEMERFGLATIVRSQDQFVKRLDLKNDPLARDSFFAQQFSKLVALHKKQQQALQRFKKLLSRLDKEWTALQVHGDMKEPRATARENTQHLTESKARVRRIHDLCKSLLQIARQYPAMGIPQDLLAAINNIRKFSETFLREVVPEAEEQIDKQRHVEKKSRQLRKVAKQVERLYLRFRRLCNKADALFQEGMYSRQPRQYVEAARQCLSDAGACLKQIDGIARRYPDLNISRNKLRASYNMLKDYYEQLGRLSQRLH